MAIENTDLNTYMNNDYPKIEGWFSSDFVIFLEQMDKLQKKYSITGGAAEIGVHHGKSFIPMAILKKEYQNLAIDIFENQYLNVDHSGKGCYATFINNLNKYIPEEKVLIVKGDSNFIDDDFIQNFVKEHGHLAIFSVDGGHTMENTFSDILTAQKFLHNGSFMILDDYYNQDWPGVHEGFIKYLTVGDVKFVPLFYGFGKMVLCDRSFFKLYYKFFAEFCTPEQGYKIKNVKLCGHDFISIKK